MFCERQAPSTTWTKVGRHSSPCTHPASLDSTSRRGAHRCSNMKVGKPGSAKTPPQKKKTKQKGAEKGDGIAQHARQHARRHVRHARMHGIVICQLLSIDNPCVVISLWLKSSCSRHLIPELASASMFGVIVFPVDVSHAVSLSMWPSWAPGTYVVTKNKLKKNRRNWSAVLTSASGADTDRALPSTTSCVNLLCLVDHPAK